MTLKQLLIITSICLVLSAVVAYLFNDYLFARVLNPNSKNTSLSAGQALDIPIGTIPPNATITITLCGQGGAGSNCFPLAANITDSPAKVRIPIGYPAGPATIEVQEKISAGVTRTQQTIPITIK